MPGAQWCSCCCSIMAARIGTFGTLTAVKKWKHKWHTLWPLGIVHYFQYMQLSGHTDASNSRNWLIRKSSFTRFNAVNTRIKVGGEFFGTFFAWLRIHNCLFTYAIWSRFLAFSLKSKKKKHDFSDIVAKNRAMRFFQRNRAPSLLFPSDTLTSC